MQQKLGKRYLNHSLSSFCQTKRLGAKIKPVFLWACDHCNESRNFGVEDVQSSAGYVMHIGKVVDGAYKVGDTVSSSVEYGTRHDIIPNHTMTHVLNLALRYLIFCFLIKIISSSWIKLFVPEFYVSVSQIAIFSWFFGK